MKRSVDVCGNSVSLQWVNDGLDLLKDLETATECMIQRCVAWASAKTHTSADHVVIDKVEIHQSVVSDYRVIHVWVVDGLDRYQYSLAAKCVGNCYANWLFCESDVKNFQQGLLKVFHTRPDLEDVEFHESILHGEAMLHVHFNRIAVQDELGHSGELIDYLIKSVSKLAEAVGNRVGAPAGWCVPIRLDVCRHPRNSTHLLVQFYSAWETEPFTNMECVYLGEEYKWSCISDMQYVEDDMVIHIVENHQCGSVWRSDV